MWFLYVYVFGFCIYIYIYQICIYIYICNVAIRGLYINVLSESSKSLHTYDIKLSTLIHPNKMVSIQCS